MGGLISVRGKNNGRTGQRVKDIRKDVRKRSKGRKRVVSIARTTLQRGLGWPKT